MQAGSPPTPLSPQPKAAPPILSRCRCHHPAPNLPARHTNAVGPGFIATPLLSALPPDARAWLAALHPIGRLGTADEVANLTLFLLSDKAAFITGSHHLVDDGSTAQ